MDDFGRYLRRLRQERDMTLKEVESVSGVSNAYISQLERGGRKSPHPDILKGLSKAYRIPVEVLFRAAGYLGDMPQREPTREEIDRAYGVVRSNPQFQHGTRLKGSALSLQAKRFIVELYEKATNQKLL
jgi:transcriptional regulator with XRE-family HTH domain